MHQALSTIVIALGCALQAACGGGGPSLSTSPPPPPPPPPPPAPVLEAIELQPPAVQLSSGAAQQFTATGRWSDGSSRAGDVYYYATGGTVTALGLYVAGPSPGAYSLIAADKQTGRADTSAIAIGAPTGTSYTTEYADDYSAYADDAALQTAYSSNGRRIWNFGGIDWSKVNLVPDPVFGKALRTTHQKQTPFFDLVNAPSGLPGAVQRVEVKFTKGPMAAVWVRFFVRFDAPAGHPYGWRTKSPNDPSPFGGSYKVFFLHWSSPYSERGSLVYTNTFRLDAEFYVAGLAKLSEGPLPGSGGAHDLTNSSRGAEWTDGQWYEMIYLYKRVGGNTARAGAWVRRYTQNGRVSPAPFRWWMGEASFVSAPPTASSFELGGNKNHGNEFDQYVIWGPWEVVDADKFPNPWGVPGN